MDRQIRIGDTVRVSRIPPHITAQDYPNMEVRRAFEVALGNTYRVEDIDWGGWVWLNISEHEGIGVQPDCVEQVDTGP